MKRELLIATTNQGKVKEILAFLEHMPFTILTLADLPKPIVAPDEITGTVVGNATLKARYYAAASGFLTLADDGGFFIDALNGWPGAEAANTAPTVEERSQLLLDRLAGVPPQKRTAHMQAALVLVDPDSGVEFVAYGKTEGIILEKPVATDNGFGYDPIFFLPELGKTYGQLTVNEKNAVSHRGKALIRIKHHLHNTYVAKHIVVPFGLIIREGKLLMNLRNDPHRPEYHHTWEFPGGKVEFGETMHENMVREIKEEVGYDVEIVKMLQHIAVENQMQKTFAYQVFLVPYVCRITGGDGTFSDAEVIESRWFDLDDVTNQNLIGENATMYREFLPELKAMVSEFSL